MNKVNFTTTLWWVGSPEMHSFYLEKSEYNQIQEWFVNHMDEEAIVFGAEILGTPHQTHSIGILYSDGQDKLGQLSHPIFKAFPFLKDIRQELKTYNYERNNRT